MWVKICANTNLDDAARAAELGADAVGFVFARSVRQVTPAQVAAITPHLPSTVERVGVFDSGSADEIRAAAELAGLDAVQLHRRLDPELVRTLLLVRGLDVIQTLHWTLGDPESAARIDAHLETIAELNAETGASIRVLVDSQAGQSSGGTGIAFDWAAAVAPFATASRRGIRTIVAGGLRPENVREAIARLTPWGVDVASGVEAKPGSKDPVRLAEFIARAHGAERP